MSARYDPSHKPCYANLVIRTKGACDGEIRVWDLSRRSCVWRAVGHRGFVRGLAVTPDGDTFLSAGEDGMVKQWDLTVASDLAQVGPLGRLGQLGQRSIPVWQYTVAFTSWNAEEWTYGYKTFSCTMVSIFICVHACYTACGSSKIKHYSR